MNGRNGTRGARRGERESETGVDTLSLLAVLANSVPRPPSSYITHGQST